MQLVNKEFIPKGDCAYSHPLLLSLWHLCCSGTATFVADSPRIIRMSSSDAVHFGDQCRGMASSFELSQLERLLEPPGCILKCEANITQG